METMKEYIKGCDYCVDMKSLFYEKYGVIEEVYIEPDKTMSISSACEGEGISININFCPMCGIKLNEV